MRTNQPSTSERRLSTLNSARGYRVLLVILVLVVGVLWWIFFPVHWRHNESSDYFAFFAPVARSILAGEGFTSSQGKLATRYPPGFPLFVSGALAIASSLGVAESTTLWAFQLICLVVSTLLVHSTARLVFGDRIAFLAGLLWATYPLSWWLIKQPETTFPFLVFLYLALRASTHLLQAPRVSLSKAFWTGIYAGVAALVHPIALLLSPVLAGVFSFLRRDLARNLRAMVSMLLLVATLLVIAPWEVGVWWQTGYWIPLATNGPASVGDGLTFALNMPPKTYRRGIPVPQDIQNLMEEVVALSHEGQLETLDAVVRYVLRSFQEHPSTIISLYAWKVPRAWYATDSHRGEGWIALLQTIYLLLAILGIVRIRRMGSQQRRFLWLALSVISYFWLMTVLALSIVRYMIPVMGLVHILAAVGLVYCSRLLGHMFSE
jgi:4-amino-4-deoxy-L-arabinose transferase-like glycosyltransferase